MFVAVSEKGSSLNLLDDRTKTFLQSNSPISRYYCPVCSNPLMLKRGTKRQWHFAHYSYSNCDTYHEPESDLHLAGKRDLYTHFKATGQRVSLEMYFPEIKQRADLCIRDNPLTKVLEFQCASVPGEQILTRSQGYLSQGVEALWLMGSSRLKRKGTMFRLTEMEQYFIRSSHSRSNHPFMSPYLVYYYCPVTRKILIIDHIQAFSKTLFYGSFHFKPLSEIRLHHLFSPVLSSHDFSSQIRLYLNRKASYRLRPHKYFSFAERTVRQLWYEKGIPLSLHPSWVGLPHSDYTSFETSALLWQGWIFAKYFYKAKSHLYPEQVIRDIMSLTKSGLFKERFLFCRHAPIEQAVRTYFTQLETLGMIRRVSAYTFRVAPLADRISRSVEDCLNEDRLVIDFLINNTERQGIPSEKD